MEYNTFSQRVIDTIHQKLEEHLSKNSTTIAAFDADGTLWDTDVGEGFFQFLIDQRAISLPPDPWAVYLSKKRVNALDAYFWLAEILIGQPL
ncbi:MAG: haloacid dehalogenase, partial [Bdellovibrionaceae bacterium]|nr:haloacid dehalogenase [Pseudobdellovibrionaceae bacterium]MDW8190525.1 haloacid dehalogenase [Pseudobdellovibrionaceae bacterium]